MQRYAVALIASTIIPVSLLAEAKSVVVGDVRVQVLSPTLLRLEERGRNGFEDRPTFHVVGRDFPGAPADVVKGNSGTTIKAEGWRVEIPAGAKHLEGIRVLGTDGAVLYTADGKLENSKWLPGPADKPQVWTIADAPRLVPPPYGLTPAPKDDPRAATSGWDVNSGAPDVYVFLPHGDYRQLRSDYLQLTGHTPLPPLYTFGYWDSRYYPYTEATALQQIDDYRARQIPLDLLVIDTDWRVGASHGYAPNTKLFPDMGRFLQEAKAKNVRIMFNDHPEPQGAALDAKELEYRYAGLSGLLKQGVDVWWYDRNWHVGLVEPAPGLRREVWGMKLYHDMTERVRPEQRPLIMTNVDGIDNGLRHRPPNVAAHRYPIQWTGDTVASFEYLRYGVENAVYSGVHTSFAYMSEDLGGHQRDPGAEQYVRWLEYGALSPVCRVHCTQGHTRMPWTFGDEANAIVRDYVQMRYHLLPVLYAAARENYETGEPMLRRCDLEWPQFAEARRDDQYLLGNSILVAPVVTDGKEQTPVPPQWLKTPEGQPGMLGEYFNSTQPNGTPVMSRVDQTIDFDWKTASPAQSVHADNFSVRWTGILEVPQGKNVRLATQTDDGARLWIDDQLVIDAWRAQDHVTNEAAGVLEGGHRYRIRMEMMELDGNAMARLLCRETTDGPLQRTLWIPPGEWINVWSGQSVTGPKELSVAAPLRMTPMFVRSGAIVPLAPAMQYTCEKTWNPITIDLYPGTATQSETVLYEDDGISNAYEKGAFRKTKISMSREGKQVRLVIGKADGTYAGALTQRGWTLRLHTSNQPTEVRVDGTPADQVRILPRNETAMPFSVAGGSPDGSVVEVTLPAAEVGKERVVTLQAQ